MLERVLTHLRAHGVDEVVLSLGYRPDAFFAAYPDHEAVGVRLDYAVEPEPLDTAGAIAFAAGHAGIDETFIVVNGDVLSDVDTSALVAFHRSHGATATIHLKAVDDPTRFGVVPTDADGRVIEFVEKPQPGERASAAGNWISAGAYVLEREILGLIEPGRAISIEREIWPKLVGHGLHAYQARGYWLDIGTPERYMQGSFDILTGAVEVGPPRPVGAPQSCEIAPDARIGELVVLGEGVVVGAGAQIERSVVLAGAQIGDGCRLTGSVVAERAKIGANAELEEDVVVGEDAQIAAGSRLRAGTRVGVGESL